MKWYVGIRADGVYVADSNRIRRIRHVPYHSPTGLDWGYGGSGPADLALAILLDATGEVNRLPKRPMSDVVKHLEHTVS